MIQKRKESFPNLLRLQRIFGLDKKKNKKIPTTGRYPVINAGCRCHALSDSHLSLHASTDIVYFLLNEHPSVSLALPPVGWQRTCEQPAQTTTLCACENTVVMVKQPGHLTSMKKDRGAGTRVLSLCLRASAAGVGLRRSTART